MLPFQQQRGNRYCFINHPYSVAGTGFLVAVRLGWMLETALVCRKNRRGQSCRRGLSSCKKERKKKGNEGLCQQGKKVVSCTSWWYQVVQRPEIPTRSNVVCLSSPFLAGMCGCHKGEAGKDAANCLFPMADKVYCRQATAVIPSTPRCRHFLSSVIPKLIFWGGK